MSNTSGINRLSLAVADAGWFTTESLFKAVDPTRADTLLLHCMDVVNAWNKRKLPWNWIGRTKQVAGATWERELILPPGWIGRYPRFGMAPIRRTIRNWHKDVGPRNPLTLVTTYPQYLELRDQVQPDAHIYFNVDDYRLYWPGRAGQIEETEKRAVEEADLTVCVARVRAEELRRSLPEAANKIHHIPHGSPTEALAPGAVDHPMPCPDDISHLPRPLLGYVGSLEDRVDWALLDRVAEELPDSSVVLIGRVQSGESEVWRIARERCLARKNVHAIGWRSQADIHAYNRSFDVALIPYLIDHPFNVACCPTKIMDGLASARPIVSTALPECRLHGDLMRVAESPEEFIEAVRTLINNRSDDGCGRARLDWASAHTCERVVDDLLDRLCRVKGW